MTEDGHGDGDETPSETEQGADDFYAEGNTDDITEFSLDLTTPRDGASASTNGESQSKSKSKSQSTNGASASTNGESKSKSTNGESQSKSMNGESTNGTFASTNGTSEPPAEEPGSTNGESELLTDAADIDTGRDSDSDSDSDSDEVEPVELLVQLAEDGEIDPWDIDIVAVTDAFLERLDESDLRTSGRALFYASVLLRMKSDEILAPDDPEEEAPWEGAMEGGEDWDAEYDPINALESEIDRRLDRKHARGSPETLDELVRELREAEHGSWWKEHRTYDTSESPHGYHRGTQTLDYRSADDFRDDGEPDEAAVTSTAHMEDIESTIADVEAALRPHYDNGRDEVLFAEIRSTGGRPFQTFLALLFLSHRGVVHLQQDELFGDLWVQNPAVAAVGDEAVAD